MFTYTHCLLFWDSHVDIAPFNFVEPALNFVFVQNLPKGSISYGLYTHSDQAMETVSYSKNKHVYVFGGRYTL